jgi:hypothetical protein
VFLINVPVGIAVLALTRKLLPRAIKRKGSVDYLGAVSITSALVLLLYAIVTANDVGWGCLCKLSSLWQAYPLWLVPS